LSASSRSSRSSRWSFWSFWSRYGVPTSVDVLVEELSTSRQAAEQSRGPDEQPPPKTMPDTVSRPAPMSAEADHVDLGYS